MRKKKAQKEQQEESCGYIRHVREVPDEKECPDCGGSGYDPGIASVVLALVLYQGKTTSIR